MMDASDQQDGFVVAASFSLPHEAQFAKGLLESYGIEVFLADENTAGMGVHLSHIIGGAKLMVRRTDLPHVLEVLGSVEAGETQLPDEETGAQTASGA
jgi:hypothetical protein